MQLIYLYLIIQSVYQLPFFCKHFNGECMVCSVCKINKLRFFIHERVLTIKQFNYLL